MWVCPCTPSSAKSPVKAAAPAPGASDDTDDDEDEQGEGAVSVSPLVKLVGLAAIGLAIAGVAYFVSKKGFRK